MGQGEVRLNGVLRSSFGGGFFPASQRIRVCSLRERRGSLRHATMLFGKRAKSSRRWGGLGLSWYLEALKKYAVFSGRSRRREYWYFVLFNIIVGIVLGWIDALLGTRGSYAGAGLLSGIYSPGGPHPYFGRDRKEAPRHRSLGLVDTDRFGATDRSDSALGVRLAGRHAGRQPVWPEPERGHSQGGLRSVVRRTHPSAWKGYSRKSKA
jgi:hypothetical protein